MVLKSLAIKPNACTSIKSEKKHNQPTLTLSGSEIPIIQQYKFLGITLDPKLSFILHIKQLRVKYNQTIQLLRAIAHSDWGADKKNNQTLQMYNTIKT